MKTNYKLMLIGNEEGQAVAEYLIIGTIVVLGAISASYFFSETVNVKMKEMSSAISGIKPRYGLN